MATPPDPQEARRSLDALISMVRCVTANYGRLTLEVKQAVLKEVRANLGALVDSGLSLNLTERSDKGGSQLGPTETIFGTLCPVPPLSGRNCFWDADGLPATKTQRRSVVVTPSDLAKGVGLIHDELGQCSDPVGLAFLQDLAHLLELFEPRM